MTYLNILVLFSITNSWVELMFLISRRFILPPIWYSLYYYCTAQYVGGFSTQKNVSSLFLALSDYYSIFPQIETTAVPTSYVQICVPALHIPAPTVCPAPFTAAIYLSFPNGLLTYCIRYPSYLAKNALLSTF